MNERSRPAKAAPHSDSTAHDTTGAGRSPRRWPLIGGVR